MARLTTWTTCHQVTKGTIRSWKMRRRLRRKQGGQRLSAQRRRRERVMVRCRHPCRGRLSQSSGNKRKAHGRKSERQRLRSRTFGLLPNQVRNLWPAVQLVPQLLFRWSSRQTCRQARRRWKIWWTELWVQHQAQASLQTSAKMSTPSTSELWQSQSDLAVARPSFWSWRRWMLAYAFAGKESTSQTKRHGRSQHYRSNLLDAMSLNCSARRDSPNKQALLACGQVLRWTSASRSPMARTKANTGTLVSTATCRS